MFPDCSRHGLMPPLARVPEHAKVQRTSPSLCTAPGRIARDLIPTGQLSTQRQAAEILSRRVGIIFLGSVRFPLRALVAAAKLHARGVTFNQQSYGVTTIPWP